MLWHVVSLVRGVNKRTLVNIRHAMWQVPFLTYRLPAVACAPPLLLRLKRQQGRRGTLLSVHVTASPNLPGSLCGIKLALDVPSFQGNAPSKVRLAGFTCHHLSVLDALQRYVKQR